MKFVSKELAIKLKEKGFDKPCFGWYNTDNEILKLHSCEGTARLVLEHPLNCEYIIDAPTTDQVLEWLREEKNVHIGIMSYVTMTTKNNIMWLWEILLVGKFIECKNTLYVDKDYNYTKLASEDYCASYDDACIDAIEFVIEHLI